MLLPCFLLVGFYSILALALGPRPPRVRPEGISTYKPGTPGQLNGTAFTEWVSTQSKAGHKVLGLAEGAYHVTASSDVAHIYLANLDSSSSLCKS